MADGWCNQLQIHALSAIISTAYISKVTSGAKLWFGHKSNTNFGTRVEYIFLSTSTSLVYSFVVRLYQIFGVHNTYKDAPTVSMD